MSIGESGVAPKALARPQLNRAARLRPTRIVGALCALAAFYFLPDALSDYWLRTFVSATALGICCLSASLLFAQLGMVSLAQFALLGVGGWFALRISHGLGVPFEVALLTGGFAAAFVGVIVGLPALRMRGLYLAIITLMMAGAIQVVISAFGFPDGGPGILGKSATTRVMMARPVFALGDEAYFRYAIVVFAHRDRAGHRHVRRGARPLRAERDPAGAGDGSGRPQWRGQDDADQRAVGLHPSHDRRGQDRTPMTGACARSPARRWVRPSSS